MAEPVRKSSLMTIAEFLAWDSGDDLRYELVDGTPVAMNPPVAPHARLVILLGGAIERRLKPPCGVYAGGGARHPDDEMTYRVPDLAISCTPSRRHWVEAPEVVIEIASPSTEKKDVSVKLAFYRSLPSVREILLVRTERRHVEHWRREGEHWSVRDLIGNAAIALERLAEPVPLEEIYAPLELEAEEEG
jgi:Uma2 family endonuclease